MFWISPLPTPYTIASGDTGLGLASRYEVGFDALSSANPGVVWDNLQIGSTLQIPAATVTVSPLADTMSPNANAPAPGNEPNAAKVIGPLAAKAFDRTEGMSHGPDKYRLHTGDGSLRSNWPGLTSWLSWDAMVDNVKSTIGKNCVGGVAPNSDQETLSVLEEIMSVSTESDIDPRFVLAIVMQESNGCVRVQGTVSPEGIANPGIMQSNRGTGSCNRAGIIQNPCPRTEIRQMIRDGVVGKENNPDAVALVPLVNKASKKGTENPAQAYYWAARFYNSGPNSLIDGEVDLGAPGATRCYVSDIANRLTGWMMASHDCAL